MELTELLRAAGDLTLSGFMLIVLWQGLKRFDALLNLVITLAAQSKMSPDEVAKIRRDILGNNGGKDA